MNKNIIKNATDFAFNAHKGQIRKYSGELYIFHPIRVSILISMTNTNIDMIVAALLHDVVEDTKFTIQDIFINFGPNVAYIVNGLTKISKLSDGNRKKRIEIDRLFISKFSNDVKTIKIADIIDNCGCMLSCDSKFKKKYFLEKISLLKVLSGGNSFLFNMAKEILEV